jgi:hypothetical protein
VTLPPVAAPPRSLRADQRRRLERLRSALARLEPAAAPADGGGILPLGLAEAMNSRLNSCRSVSWLIAAAISGS